MIRAILEQSTRHWTFQRRLPARLGNSPIVVSPAGGLRYLFRRSEDLDPLLMNFVETFIRPGHTIWDVGANVGLFSVASAARTGNTGKVFAFEPDSWLVQLLRKTSAIQPASNARIEVLPVGLAHELGFRRFGIAQRSRSTNHLEGYGSTQTGGIAEWIHIFCITLDWALEKLPAPDILKIDVEGAELELLENAPNMLSRHRPILHVEVAGEVSQRVSEIFAASRYLMLDGDAPPGDRPPVSLATANTIAIPEEKFPLAR